VSEVAVVHVYKGLYDAFSYHTGAAGREGEGRAWQNLIHLKIKQLFFKYISNMSIYI
jgi:hypothetical protein